MQREGHYVESGFGACEVPTESTCVHSMESAVMGELGVTESRPGPDLGCSPVPELNYSGRIL